MRTVQEGFRKTVRKALIDKGKTVSWLAKEINTATGMHLDTSYLGKVYDGHKGSRRVIEETCRILGLDLPESYKQ